VLNVRLLLSIIHAPSVDRYLTILSISGIVLLSDLVIILAIGRIIGIWLILTILTVTSAAGYLIARHSLHNAGTVLDEALRNGFFPEEGFPRYLSTLLAAIPLIVPGVVSTLGGLLWLFPPVRSKTGRALSRYLGVDWHEAYEYLKLTAVD
jgi:UPF0716 protein FxsA